MGSSAPISVSFAPTVARAARRAVQALKDCFSDRFGNTQRNYIDKGRAALRKAGFEPNPVGVGNTKTELPGTYRKVGRTCPLSCALLDNGCYAQRGHVALAERRATEEVENDLASASLAIMTAFWMDPKKKVPARLHVSGDVAKDGTDLDIDYLEGLIVVARAAREAGIDSPVLAYLYSHVPVEVLGEYILRLRQVGIFLRPSVDEPTKGGAFVVDSFEEVAQLKEDYPGIKFFKCLEQIAGISCANCGGCFEKKTAQHCVLFEKH